jgi:hypothetical protein
MLMKAVLMIRVVTILLLPLYPPLLGTTFEKDRLDRVMIDTLHLGGDDLYFFSDDLCVFLVMTYARF